MLSSITATNYRTKDTTGGVQSLIDNGKSSQANESFPNNEHSHQEANIPKATTPDGIWSIPQAKPLFSSLVGFALEIGDRLLINGEEVIFKGWVDQSQTAIEVKTIGNDTAQVKQIRAKEIKSLSRSQDIGNNSEQSEKNKSESHQNFTKNSKTSSDQTSAEAVGQAPSDQAKDDEKDINTSADVEASVEAKFEPKPEEPPEIPKEPEYNAWEVWTYLERQRVKTLKLLNTFQAEWEANRFVREAERSTPANLRVHYEIRPVLLDESEIRASYQNEETSHKPKNSQTDQEQENYADAIDVEIVGES